jgi:hypothetical protein
LTNDKTRKRVVEIRQLAGAYPPSDLSYCTIELCDTVLRLLEAQCLTKPLPVFANWEESDAQHGLLGQHL